MLRARLWNQVSGGGLPSNSLQTTQLRVPEKTGCPPQRTPNQVHVKTLPKKGGCLPRRYDALKGFATDFKRGKG